MKIFGFALMLVLLSLFIISGGVKGEDCTDLIRLNGKCTGRRCAFACIAKHTIINEGQCYNNPPNTCICSYACKEQPPPL
ncbi:hypothetical protein FRX31_010609 [Thalictrum thalictroides]|uniref:Defensin-like protein n=1 Tax=Thalictrum thalictroides TaxID=46969 RepID=A0A7J6WSI2_THATH|nr:hypothetical protein FRX31_010609 [Thalictrum thalictroides]